MEVIWWLAASEALAASSPTLAETSPSRSATPLNSAGVPLFRIANRLGQMVFCLRSAAYSLVVDATSLDPGAAPLRQFGIHLARPSMHSKH